MNDFMGIYSVCKPVQDFRKVSDLVRSVVSIKSLLRDDEQGSARGISSLPQAEQDIMQVSKNT